MERMTASECAALAANCAMLGDEELALAWLAEADKAIDDDISTMCQKHGVQPVVEITTFTGFAGGTCYAARLACGCGAVDDSDDLEAAR